ncbi:dual specificity protein kinase-like protein [Dermatophagoides farinae]|uniref:Dual serine/threonine and tyrosine protein kinase n=1 Tax=Dermatophagoides farinae TaxID=6954 RepID=A0A9D4P7B3_DERFA|nr:dual specificity protein kinase-like protein [Dermatophagoides farinae]
MQQQMRYEAEYFDDKKRLLRAIFNETLAQCNDALHKRNISKDKFQEMSLKFDDERYIRNMLDNPISIVLMGSRPCVKARIVNYMLGYELLPVFDVYDPDYKQPRRSVRIQYGTQRRLAFCIRHFELLECSPLHTERVVSFEDLRLDFLQDDPTLLASANGTHDDLLSSNPELSDGYSDGLQTSLVNGMTNGDRGGINGGSGGSNASSGLDSAGNDQSSNTPTTLSFNSSCSLIKSAPTTTSNHVNRHNNQVRMAGQSRPQSEKLNQTNTANTGAAAVAAAVNHVIQNAGGGGVNGVGVGVGHRHGHSSGYSSQQNVNLLLQQRGQSGGPVGDNGNVVGDDFVNEMTTMEIVLPHELLEKNLQIRVAPDVESFDLIYRTTFSRTNPIIIYCFERSDEMLTETDRRHLQQLRQRMPSTPIFFAHIMDFNSVYHHHPAGAYPYHAHPSYPLTNPNGSQTHYPSSNMYRFTMDPPVAPSRISAKISNSNGNSCSAEFIPNITNPTTKTTTTTMNMTKTTTAKKLPARRNTHCLGEQPIGSEFIWKQLREMGFFQEMPSTVALQAPMDRRQKHQSNGYYIINDRPFKCSKQNADNGMDVSSRFICHSYEFCYFVDFFRSILKSNLVVAATLLNEIHNQFIQYYIFTAFDMTWNLNYCIPKRLEYARKKEAELYMSLMGIANRKQEEIRQLIGETLQFMRDDILTQASSYRFGNPVFNTNPMVSAAEVKHCAEEIQDFVFMTLNRAIAVKLIGSVDIMRESFIGTLQRCLKQLEEYRQRRDTFGFGGGNGGGGGGGGGHLINNGHNNKHLIADNMKMVPVNPKLINGHYNHHHQRVQEEKIDLALSRLLNLAYSIEINANSCSSMLRIFWEKMKNFFLMLSIAWKPTCRIDAEWKRKVSADLLDNLSEAKLAKCICTQFREKLKLAHETFLNSLANLETTLVTRLKEIDHRRQQVRKNDAPLFARLALESTSFIDAILYGSPELGKEIGRGQYGVVFSTKKSWGNYSRIAVKSIMICDDKHWNDLAMEFYYTRSLPETDRIVQIRGSIIEHNYNGASSYVYLIMDRMVRDLYVGLKSGLEWLQRLQIAFDVVHGLRFLHNHGLIHRDIKLKNVLLDKYNRAKITDLGFCKSEVMISGSIVGTPIHMAPEVFTGKYDSMVDVYAFGILFWYICAGSVELPQIFEQCHNKDHLWIAVKKGLRPEKLAIFDDECFNLMERCWAGDPLKRPLLGEVEEVLLDIKMRHEREYYTNNPIQITNNATIVNKPIYENEKLIKNPITIINDNNNHHHDDPDDEDRMKMKTEMKIINSSPPLSTFSDTDITTKIATAIV